MKRFFYDQIPLPIIPERIFYGKEVIKMQSYEVVDSYSRRKAQEQLEQDRAQGRIHPAFERLEELYLQLCAVDKIGENVKGEFKGQLKDESGFQIYRDAHAPAIGFAGPLSITYSIWVNNSLRFSINPEGLRSFGIPRTEIQMGNSKFTFSKDGTMNLEAVCIVNTEQRKSFHDLANNLVEWLDESIRGTKYQGLTDIPLSIRPSSRRDW
jgi:hypothetical protein